MSSWIYRVELNARKAGDIGTFTRCTFDVIAEQARGADGAYTRAIAKATAHGYETRGANSAVRMSEVHA